MDKPKKDNVVYLFGKHSQEKGSDEKSDTRAEAQAKLAEVFGLMKKINDDLSAVSSKISIATPSLKTEPK